MLAADYSWARPDLAQLHAAGYRIILRYLGNDTGGRDLSAAELERLHAAGFMVALIAESSARRPLSGAPGGREDADRFNALAAARGAPSWLPIFYAVDYDAASDDSIPTVENYFRGILERPGRPVGSYGQYQVCEALRNLVWNGRRVEHRWQCAAWSGSGVGTGGSIQSGYTRPVRVSAGICLFQHYGLTGPFGDSIDRNEVFGTPDWAWHPTITPTAPHEHQEDPTMPTNVVFCPDQTQGVGWQVLPGRRRVGFRSQEELAVAKKVGDVSGDVTLNGPEGQLFLDLYREEPYTGAVIARPKADSRWATEVAGLAPGDRPRFIMLPSGITVRIRDDHHRDVDVFLGVRDAGEMDDVFFYNGVLMPWVLSSGGGSGPTPQAIAGAVVDTLRPELGALVEQAAGRAVDAELDGLAD